MTKVRSLIRSLVAKPEHLVRLIRRRLRCHQATDRRGNGPQGAAEALHRLHIERLKLDPVRERHPGGQLRQAHLFERLVFMTRAKGA